MLEETTYYKYLGTTLKVCRHYRKIQLAEIAELLNVSIQQLHKYESGKNRIPVQKLELYCQYVNIRLDDLLAWSKMETIN